MRRKVNIFITLVVLLSFLMGTTAFAAPDSLNLCGEEANTQTGSAMTSHGQDQIQQPFADPITRVNVKYIRIYPCYMKPGEEGLFKGLGYYENSQIGGQGIGLEITPKMKATLDKLVTDNGYVQYGYFYEVQIAYPGTFTLGRLEVNEPADMSSHSVLSNEVWTYTFIRPFSNCNLQFNGAFWYTYQSRRLSQSMAVWSRFTTE